MLVLFLLLVVAVSVTRLIELRLSRAHRRQLLARGAATVPDPGFAVMVALHVGILLCSVLEVLVFSRPTPIWFGTTMAAGVAAANALRIWAIRSLGTHWNVRVVDSTELGVVSAGPYRWIRHPNYVAVFLELFFLPLVHGAWVTASVGTILHIVVLQRRITVEERVLMADADYRRVMGGKPRFAPWVSARGQQSRAVGP